MTVWLTVPSPAAAAVAVLSAGLAALLAVRAVPSPPSGDRPGPAPGRHPARLAAGPAIAGAGAVAWLDGTTLALGLILLGCALGVAALVLRARGLATRLERRRRVVEVAEALAGELRAGQPPMVALQRCAEVWAPVAPVAAAARLGADVPAALDRVARLPGAEGLREVGSAWRVSERSGAGLGQVLAEVVASARAQLASAQLVRTELASAQATARLVSVLPLVTITMGSGAGAHPWRFLLAHPVGLACLAAGAALMFTGLWWIDRIALAVSRG